MEKPQQEIIQQMFDFEHNKNWLQPFEISSFPLLSRCVIVWSTLENVVATTARPFRPLISDR